MKGRQSAEWVSQPASDALLDSAIRGHSMLSARMQMSPVAGRMQAAMQFGFNGQKSLRLTLIE